MKRYRCHAVLAEDRYKEGETTPFIREGAELWGFYLTEKEKNDPAEVQKLLTPPEPYFRVGGKSVLEGVPLKLVWEELPDETAITPAKLLALPRIEPLHDWALEDAAEEFGSDMTGEPWEEGTLLFEEDSPLQVFYRFRGHPGYFVDVQSLEWNAQPFALLVSLHDDRKYSRGETIILDQELAHRALEHILEARMRGLLAAARAAIHTRKVEQTAPETPIVLFDANQIHWSEGTIKPR